MDDPWGSGDLPAVTDLRPLPRRMTDLLQRVDAGEQLAADEIDYLESLQPEDFDEVAALLNDGWELVDDAPVCCLVPAAWSPLHRTWVPDRVPHLARGYDEHAQPTNDIHDAGSELHQMLTETAQKAGLPDPPSGRIWLLRSPWPGMTVSEIVDRACTNAETSTGTRAFGAEDVYRAVAAMMREA